MKEKIINNDGIDVSSVAIIEETLEICKVGQIWPLMWCPPLMEERRKKGVAWWYWEPADH